MSALYRPDEAVVFHGAVAPSAFSPTPALHINRETGALALNKGGNASWTSEVLITDSETGDILSANAPRLFALVAHQTNDTINKLRFGVSRDGIIFKSIGATLPWAPAVGGVRDPSMFYYASTEEWIISYTRAGPAATYATSIGTFDNKIGLSKTRDFKTITELTSITIAGISPTHDYIWNGSWLVDDGNYYLFVLPIPATGNRDTPGAGWIRCTNPGVWTTWTNFTPIHTANPNWSAVTEINDIKVLKLLDGTYRAVFDGITSGTHKILTATSLSPLSDYSAPTAVSGHSAREGAIITEKPGGGYRLYSEVVYGRMQYSDTDDNFVTMGTKTDIGWREFLFVGNGDVLAIDSLAAQASLLAAEEVRFSVPNSADNNQLRTDVPSLQWAAYIGTAATGNGSLDASSVAIGTNLFTASAGGFNFGVPVYAIAGLTVYSSLAFSDASVLAASRVNLGLGVPTTPASASAAGVAGTIAWDANFIYVCIATNTWKRVAIATW